MLWNLVLDSSVYAGRSPTRPATKIALCRNAVVGNRHWSIFYVHCWAFALRWGNSTDTNKAIGERIQSLLRSNSIARGGANIQPNWKIWSQISWTRFLLLDCGMNIAIESAKRAWAISFTFLHVVRRPVAFSVKMPNGNASIPIPHCPAFFGKPLVMRSDCSDSKVPPFIVNEFCQIDSS